MGQKQVIREARKRLKLALQCLGQSKDSEEDASSEDDDAAEETSSEAPERTYSSLHERIIAAANVEDELLAVEERIGAEMAPIEESRESLEGELKQQQDVDLHGKDQKIEELQKQLEQAQTQLEAELEQGREQLQGKDQQVEDLKKQLEQAQTQLEAEVKQGREQLQGKDQQLSLIHISEPTRPEPI
eukprot:3418847-Pyramimonas_sp.AAC.2